MQNTPILLKSEFLQEVTESFENLGTFLKIIILVSILIPFVMIYIRNAKSAYLQEGFRSLGNMTGMSKEKIIKVVGNPNSVNHTAGGELSTWISPRYNITIHFDANGKFVGVVSENYI